jgi:hypothetical protein
VGLVPKRGCLLTLTYYAFSRWYEFGERRWNDIDGKTEELGEKPIPVPLCPPQIPHGLTQALTRASMVRGWWLTTWAMARPSLNSYINIPNSLRILFNWITSFLRSVNSWYHIYSIVSWPFFWFLLSKNAPQLSINVIHVGSILQVLFIGQVREAYSTTRR